MIVRISSGWFAVIQNGGDDEVPCCFSGLKMAQNNFYDDYDKNSQEAPGQAMFIS